MIGIALLVPAAGGMIEVVLTIAAITGGPLLLPALWALFSKKINGRAAFMISAFCLLINCMFKFITPYLLEIKLDRSQEMLLGTGLPLLLLMVNEFIVVRRKESADYVRYILSKQEKKMNLALETADEKMAILKQNLFGLRVIAFALAFTSLLLVGISFVSISGKMMVLGIAAAILLSAIIPLRATRKIKFQLLTISTQKAGVAEAVLD
jgi:solute:Na+ symporter, SSS family